MAKILMHTLLAVSTVFALMPAALAHEEGDAHDALHDSLDSQHQTVHELLNQGLITPDEHDQLDARLRAEHRAFHENYDDNYGYPQGYYDNYNSGYYPQYNWVNPWARHQAQHQALNAAHRDIHRLVREGLISPQEHAALDAQLRAAHERSHANYNQDYWWGNPRIFGRMNTWFGF